MDIPCFVPYGLELFKQKIDFARIFKTQIYHSTMDMFRNEVDMKTKNYLSKNLERLSPLIICSTKKRQFAANKIQKVAHFFHYNNEYE